MRIWTALAHLDRPKGEAAALGELLSADERQRAARFVHETHRHRYTVARATLRLLLGRCAGTNAAAIEFRYAEHGKPLLAGALAESMHFNVSHSDSFAFYAISPDGPLGCDIERIRPVPEMADIVSRWFAPSEHELILSRADRDESFFRYWTLKEAVLKGVGSGLALLSRDFELTSRANDSFYAQGLPELNGWTAIPCSAPAGFAAAVAVPADLRLIDYGVTS
jgi:4'-phosphopantetheinyl transferase